MFIEVALFCIAIALLFGYWNVNQIYTIWLKCNIPFVRAQFPYGNIRDVGEKVHIFELTNNLYKKMKKEAPVAGFHVLTNAAVVVTDLDIVKKILVSDSNLFMDRGMYVNASEDPLSCNMYNLDGAKYEAVHSKLMPLFSPEKIKLMFESMELLANRLSNHLFEAIDGEPTDLNVQYILCRYSADVMGTIFLGIDCNSLNDEDAELLKISRKYLARGREKGLKHFFRNTFQETAKRLNMTETPKPLSDFFTQTIKTSIENREKSKIERNDLIDLLMNLKNAGEMNTNAYEKSGCITVDEAIAQAYYFYVAGFETMSTTLSLCLYEMSKGRDVQESLRRQIFQVFNHSSEKPTSDTIHEIPLLDQVINGMLRCNEGKGIRFAIK